MKKIALVDDDLTNIEILKKFLEKISIEEGEIFVFDNYLSGEAFLFDYHPYDIIFLDIEMKEINGLETARKIREKDNESLIIFQTKMAQFASEGYDVDAIGYLIKPITYESLKIKMKKAIRILDTQKKSETIVINVGGAKKMMSTRDILYLEADGHQVCFHTKEGIIDGWGSLKNYKNQLASLNFVEISRYNLVNLKYVNKIEGNNLIINGETLSIGRTKKNALLKEIASYFRGF